MSNQEYAEQEINLRDYINVIVKRKKIILTVFFVSVITTAILSFFIPKVYQATASIMILPSKAGAVDIFSLPMEKKEGKLGEYVAQKSTLPFPTHKVLLKSDIVLERVINRLKLTNKSGKSLIPDDLSKRLDVKEVKETNILQLKTEDNDPRMAKEIVNNWLQEYIRYNQEFISGEVGGTGDFIVGQFEIAKQNITQAEEKVKDSQHKYKIDLMRAELDIKKRKLNYEKEELGNLESILKTKEDSLIQLKKEIEKQEKFIIISKAITDDALWQKQDKGDLGDLNKRKLRSEQINPIYQDLEIRIVNTEIELNTLKPKFEYLKKSIESTGKEIDKLEESINRREFELTQLSRQAAIYKRTYDSLAARIEEARISKAMQLGEVKVISLATEPRYPIKPSKRQNVAISGIIGLMMGIFLAFFAEYWGKSKK